MAKILIKQVVSRINRPARHKRTLDSLGLKKLNQATPQVLGMVNQVRHLVEVKNA